MNLGGIAAGAKGASDAQELEVEEIPPPLTPDAWRGFEEASRSYTSTREFVEYFEDLARAVLVKVASVEGETRGVFLVQLQDGSARVLSRFFACAPEALAALAQAVFARHPEVARIETGFIQAPRPRTPGRPALAVHETVQLLVDLPETVEAYDRVLDPAFLKRSRHDERKLAHQLTDWSVDTLEDAAVPRAWIAEVARLNRERRAAQGGLSMIDTFYEEGIAAVVRRRGMVTVLRSGDRVLAGTIAVRSGPCAYGWVNGHDSAYNRLSPGIVCLLASIRHCIRRGIRVYDLLVGDSPYKRAVGGRPAPAAAYVVLRSWAALRPGDVRLLARKHGVRTIHAAMALGDKVGERFTGRRFPFSVAARRALRGARKAWTR